MFRFSGDVLKHQRVHTEDRAFPCPQCNKWFKTDIETKNHQNNVHKEERNFECLQCEKMFKSSKALQMHNLSHINARPFECKKCVTPQCFKTSIALKRHNIVLHSEEKPFKCDECSKPFVLNGQLKRHKLQVHAPKVRPSKQKFECDQCDFVTSEQHSASGLNIHKKYKHMDRTKKGTSA